MRRQDNKREGKTRQDLQRTPPKKGKGFAVFFAIQGGRGGQGGMIGLGLGTKTNNMAREDKTTNEKTR